MRSVTLFGTNLCLTRESENPRIGDSQRQFPTTLANFQGIKVLHENGLRPRYEYHQKIELQKNVGLHCCCMFPSTYFWWTKIFYKRVVFVLGSPLENERTTAFFRKEHRLRNIASEGRRRRKPEGNSNIHTLHHPRLGRRWRPQTSPFWDKPWPSMGD